MKKLFHCRSMLVAVFALIVSPIGLAKSINLYEKSEPNSKQIGTIESDVGIIPIFAPKEEGWLKVADPRNGNVGWVKSADLKNAKINFTLIRTTNGGNGCEISQHSSVQSPDQVRRMMEKIKLQQQVVKKEMEQMMQDTWKIIHQSWE